MKEIIRLGITLQLIKENKNLSTELINHRFYQLWNYVRKVIQKQWPRGPKDNINATERIVQEFHSIDKSGQGLRYTKDLSGNRNLRDLPESVHLTHLLDVFNVVFNFLDSA